MQPCQKGPCCIYSLCISLVSHGQVTSRQDLVQGLARAVKESEGGEGDGERLDHLPNIG